MTVRKEENGTWSVRCWYHNWKGERKQKTKRGFAKRKDAQQWERDFLAQEQNQIITMAALIDSYLVFLKKQRDLGIIAESTWDLKDSCIRRYIIPYFSGADASSVSLKIVNDWISWMGENFGGKRGKLSTSTLRNYRSYLHQIFEHGQKYYGLGDNPTTGAEIPQGISNDTRVDFWPLETYEKFYVSIRKDHHRVIFNTMYWGGLRIGEVLGLTPDDLQGNRLSIRKAWRTLPAKQSHIADPKTKSSFRSVVIPTFLAEQLNDYMQGIDGLKPTDRIFPFSRMSVYKAIKSRIKKLKLPNASPHTMRHSYASNMLAESKDYVATSAQLGHASPKITFGIYAHAQDEAVKNSVDLLEKLHKK